MININPTTANFPGLTYTQAVAYAHKMKSAWANILTEHLQLCPQQQGKLDENMCEKIMEKFPNTQFRCHANIRLLDNLHIFDASCDQSLDENQLYLKLLTQVTKKLNAPAYSVHAGKRNISLKSMKDNIHRLEDLLGIPVAVEGLYPDEKNQWLLNSWKEYEWLLNSGLNMAIDLSHLQILSYKEKHWCDDFVKALIQANTCLEIHVAGNDEVHDNHQQVMGSERWIKLLDNTLTSAIIFTEENQRKTVIKRK